MANVFKVGRSYFGLSSDTKPTPDSDGELFYEVDTGRCFIRRAGVWRDSIEWLLRNAQIRHVGDASGWTNSTTGTGSNAVKPERLAISSGTTASSSGRLSSGTITCLSRGSAGIYVMNWAKRAVLQLAFCPVGATTNGQTALQWGRSGDVNTDADLDAAGIGVRIDNLALKGLAHNGTSLTVVDLSTTLTLNQIYQMEIVSDGAGNVEWFLDGVSKGTSALGPSALGSAANTSFQGIARNQADAVNQAADFAPPVLYVYQ